MNVIKTATTNKIITKPIITIRSANFNIFQCRNNECIQILPIAEFAPSNRFDFAAFESGFVYLKIYT